MTNTYPWRTESIRFSFLGVSEGSLSWRALTGKDAESQTNRPAQQLTIEEGPFLSGRLVITSQPGRVDVTLTAMPTEPSAHPSLGEFKENLMVFQERLMSTKLPTAARVAFGAVLNLFPASQEESGAMIRQLIPSFELAREATDISLQFNIPKKLPKVSGIVLNRLTKYSQLITQLVHYTEFEQKTKRSQVLQMEIDINTHPDFRVQGSTVYATLVPAILAEADSLVQ